MRIVCISDTHTYGPIMQRPIPLGDVLIHSGDLTFRGTETEVRAELTWLASQPHENKLFIAGNHDFFFDPNHPAEFRGWKLRPHIEVADMLAELPGLTYLEDSGVLIDGIIFYGSPWQPPFYDWAFNLGSRGNPSAQEVWSNIPLDTNVLITHGPPAGILDWTYDTMRKPHYLNNDEYDFGGRDNRKGCPVLREKIAELKQLKLHTFGHLHEAYGFEERDGVMFFNAAINTREYEPINPPMVFDL